MIATLIPLSPYENGFAAGMSVMLGLVVLALIAYSIGRYKS